MNSIFDNFGIGTLGRPTLPKKRHVFISYHHGGDQRYYDQLSAGIENEFVPIRDNSLDRSVDSDNVDYVMQRIRDQNISGTSCTIVLCGAETGLRKYVDWEIKATLDKQHGLLGVALPTCRTSYDGKYLVPDRLHDNLVSRFALFINWNDIFPPQTIGHILGSTLNQSTGALLKQYIDKAALQSSYLISNNREKMKRNGVLR